MSNDDLFRIIHVGARATRNPRDGSWEGQLSLPTASGILVVRGSVPRATIDRLCGAYQRGEEVSGMLDGLLGGAGGLLGGLLGGGGGGGSGGSGGSGGGGLLGGLLGGGSGGSGGGGLLGGLLGGGGGGLGSLLGSAADMFIPGAGSIVGPLAGQLLGGVLGGGGGGQGGGGLLGGLLGGGGGGGGGPLGGIGQLLSGILGGGAPPAAMQAAPALLGGANAMATASQLATSAPQLFGTLAGPISNLMRTGLRAVDAEAGRAMGDPNAAAAISRARQSAERRVANALRVAEGILAQHT